MTAKNDVTGDSIRTKVSNSRAYAAGWDRIFGKKKKSKKAIQGSSNGRTKDFESFYLGSNPSP